MPVHVEGAVGSPEGVVQRARKSVSGQDQGLNPESEER